MVRQILPLLGCFGDVDDQETGHITREMLAGFLRDVRPLRDLTHIC
jgi:hypothetical protein